MGVVNYFLLFLYAMAWRCYYLLYARLMVLYRGYRCIVFV
jgi:hypothetical protein